jgi:acetylornithine deacetylase/succinyl-diaminopimelate desuccinylase-like protein
LEPHIGASSGGFDARWIVDALHIPMVSYGAGWNGPDGKLCIHSSAECITIENLVNMSKGFAAIMLRACGVAVEPAHGQA